MHDAQTRAWLPAASRAREDEITRTTSSATTAMLRDHIDTLTVRNRDIHQHECVNLNPATNVMSPRAEAALAAGLGSRPSLGYAGDKYETGLEAIEELEVITANIACQVFSSTFAEIRVASGAMANLYAFMSACKPGDSIIVPPPTIGGHVTHNTAGAAGLYGLEIHEAPIDAESYTIDVEATRALADRVSPKLISVGGSLNLTHHPVSELRQVADDVGATLLFDAAHLCGLIAGGSWPDPLAAGAHLMTMSTYKSLAGPPGGLIVTNDPSVAKRLDAIAYPGLTANFDAGRTTALALSLLDWVDYGEEYATAMVDTARSLASELQRFGMPVIETPLGPTTSHQFAIHGDLWGGGHKASQQLREANILTCAIGLPVRDGIRMGTPEIVRWGMRREHMPELAGLVARALTAPSAKVAADVTAFRSRFDQIGYCST